MVSKCHIRHVKVFRKFPVRVVCGPSIIDEHGCLRKDNKSVLCNRLGVVQVDPSTSDVVIVDSQ